MAGLVSGSGSSRCLVCLRRLAQPFASNSVRTNTASLVLTRAKSRTLRPQDQGVVVRLLTDIPRFGRKGEMRCSLALRLQSILTLDAPPLS